MRKHGGTPSRRDKHVTLAAIRPPGVARGHFVGGRQSGLAGCNPPPLCTRGASSCSSQGRRQGKPWGASPRPSAPTYLPVRPVSATHWLWVRGGLGVGTRHLPHSVRSCELVLRAVVAAGGRPGGAPLACVWGTRVGHSPMPDRLSFGRAAGAHYPLAVGAGGTCGLRDPSATPQRALLRAGSARCGDGRRAPGGGGGSCLPVGRPGLGALPRPTARAWGVQPGPTTDWLQV